MDPVVVAALAAFGSVLIAATAGVSLALERRRVNRSLRNVASVELAPDQLRQRALAAPARDRLVVPAVEWLGRAARRFTPLHQLERFDRKLELAGRPEGWDAPRLAAIRFFGRLLAPLATVLVLGAADVAALQVIVVAALAGLLFQMGPDVLLDGRIRRRQLAIRQAIADAIDLLVISVEAGLGFDQALDRVARQVPGALGEELHRTVQEIHLGRARTDALRSLGVRTGVVYIRAFVAAIIQAEQFGLTVSDVLRQQAEELRERRRQEAEELAQKIPVKILTPLIFFILPALFIVLLGPGAMQIHDTLLR